VNVAEKVSAGPIVVIGERRHLRPGPFVEPCVHHHHRDHPLTLAGEDLAKPGKRVSGQRDP
jgi:hypothetical protein